MMRAMNQNAPPQNAPAADKEVDVLKQNSICHRRVSGEMKGKAPGCRFWRDDCFSLTHSTIGSRAVKHNGSRYIKTVIQKL
jgi:hypothetical protein